MFWEIIFELKRFHCIVDEFATETGFTKLKLMTVLKAFEKFLVVIQRFVKMKTNA